jgi:hypothetical protein
MPHLDKKSLSEANIRTKFIRGLALFEVGEAILRTRTYGVTRGLCKVNSR